jgi:hypothetical protein
MDKLVLRLSEKEVWWRRALIVVIAGLAFAWISPYFVAEESIKRAFGSLLGGAIGMDYPQSGEQPIVVVTVDDDDLQQTGAVWPISYQYHADVLKQLALLGSKRLMVDILFVDERRDPTLPAFKDTLCALKRQGIEIFIASKQLDDGSVYLRPELAAIAAPMALPGKACFTAVTVGTRLDKYDQRAWEYPRDAKATLQNRPESAAFAIFRSISPEKFESLPVANLAVLWGTQGSEFNLKWMRKPSQMGQDSVAHCKVWSYFDLLPPFLRLDSLFNPAAADSRAVCPYHMTIPVRALQDFKGTNPFGNVGDRINGSTVFYGASLVGMQDSIESLVHGAIPGVHLHAMALDNLLNFGSGYLLAEEFSISHLSSPASLMTFACLFLIALFDIFFNAGRHEKSEKTRFRDKLWTWCKKAFFVFLLCGVLYVIGRYGFRLGPLSWIEFIVLPLVLELLNKIDEIDECIAHFFGWLADGRH